MKLLLFILLLSFSVKSQIKIVDSSDQKPISNVEIFNKNGVLIFTSDDNGMTASVNIEEYPLYISHFLYNNIELKSPDKSILLTPKSVILNSVEVKASKLKYLILEGFYRGFQTKNDSLDIYTEAKIKWIVSSKGYKNIGFEVLESRYFLSKKYNYYKQGIMLIGMKLNTFPQLQNDITKFKSRSPAKNIFVFEYPDDHGKEKEMKLLGNISKILINKDELISSSESNFLEGLIFFSHKHKLSFKSKKSDTFDRYEALDEFNPNNIYFSNDLPINLQKRIIIKEQSKYETDFWKQFERNPNFKVLSPAIVKSLNSTMEMVK
jgi:hypothetical protein